jgi:uncharacterized RDD family membrane protein YckC
VQFILAARYDARMATPSDKNFAPPKSAVADSTTDSSDAEKASRLSRLGATLIDGLLLNLPFAPSYMAAFPALMTLTRERRANMASFWIEVSQTGVLFYAGLALCIVILIIMAVLVHRNGQTIGKKLLGIKDVRTDGSRATLARIFWLRCFVNTLLTMIPVVGRLYSLVDLLMIFGPAKRCCHDYIADTIVVRA